MDRPGGGRTVVVVGYDGAELLDIACVTTCLTMANAMSDVMVDAADSLEAYAVQVVSPGAAPIRCGSGLNLDSHGALERVRGPIDTLVVSGGVGHERAAANRQLVGHVRRLARDSRRVASVCTGASVLAAAGLLDGRRATTHWRYAPRLAADYPNVTVDPDPIFIRDDVSTSAGVTSALDLTLSFVEEDHGQAIASAVARALVTYMRRPGSQTQVSVFTAPAPTGDELVRRVGAHVTTHLRDRLDLASLAAVAGVTPRHLHRVFVTQVGETPGRYVRRRRTEAAAHLLTTTTLTVSAVAGRCGFGTPESMRRAFLEAYAMPPSGVRRQASRQPQAGRRIV